MKQQTKALTTTIILLFLLITTTYAAPELVDSYSETNYSAGENIKDMIPADNWGESAQVAHSFYNTNALKIVEAKFYLKKVGSPTGNIHAYLYAINGAYGGGDDVPTGTALATSDDFDVSTLTTSYTVVSFTFSGSEQYEMEAETAYVIVCSAMSSGTLDSGNYFIVGFDGTSPTHTGNGARNRHGNWAAQSYDVCFYVYGEAAVSDNAPTYTNAANNGVTQVGETVSLSVQWQDDFSLDTCYFSTNNTGTWANSSLTVSGVSSWANTTMQLNFTSSTLIQYKWYCSDNASQWNTTQTYNITTTALSITFNLNNSTMGSFYVDTVLTANTTANTYNYNQSILLQGVTSSSLFVWQNFTWIGSSTTSNNYVYYTSGNNTVLCNFDVAGTGTGDTNIYHRGYGTILLIAVVALSVSGMVLIKVKYKKH
jgi:hypothetical protein